MKNIMVGEKIWLIFAHASKNMRDYAVTKTKDFVTAGL
jgi:hypothetical protein